MTEYLTDYMNTVERRIKECTDLKTLDRILEEHMDKIAFMQHERIVHFLVTMMFAIVLTVFITAQLVVSNIMLGVLVLIIIVLLSFYIKHYYFLENTVQKMYKVYDGIIEMKHKMEDGE